MAFAFLLLLAADRPVPHEPEPSECNKAYSLVAGQPLPAGLLDSAGIVSCSALVVPTSEALDALDAASWARWLEGENARIARSCSTKAPDVLRYATCAVVSVASCGVSVVAVQGLTR